MKSSGYGKSNFKGEFLKGYFATTQVTGDRFKSVTDSLAAGTNTFGCVDVFHSTLGNNSADSTH